MTSVTNNGLLTQGGHRGTFYRFANQDPWPARYVRVSLGDEALIEADQLLAGEFP